MSKVSKAIDIRLTLDAIRALLDGDMHTLRDGEEGESYPSLHVSLDRLDILREGDEYEVRKVKRGMKKGWINLKIENGRARVVRASGGPSHARTVYDSYNAAVANSPGDAMKPIEIEWEEEEVIP